MLGDQTPRSSVNPLFVIIPVILAFVVAIVLGVGCFIAYRTWQNGKAKEEARERESRSKPSGPPTITSEPTGSPGDPLPRPTVGTEPETPEPPSPTEPDETAPRVVSGGVLNGKAISLPKPPYPPAARAAHASGQVAVQITVDESGNVISAAAVSGHPLLRSAAVAAAREAKFSPTLLAGKPVKVTGTVIYNFAEE